MPEIVPAAAAPAAAAPVAPVTPAAAPAAPAPNVSRETPTAPADPRLSPILQAARDASERIAKGQPVVPVDSTAVAEPPAGAGDATAATDTEEPVVAAEVPPVDPNVPAPGMERVTLPPRNPGEPEIPIDVDPETAEDLRRLKNGYMRGEESREVNAESHALRQELDEMLDFAATNPTGFMREALTGHPPETAAHIALSLLASDDVYAAARDYFDKLETPEDREHLRNALFRRDAEVREQLQQQHAAAKQARTAAETIMRSIHTLAPEGLSESDRRNFALAAKDVVKQYAARLSPEHRVRLAPADLPLILREFLTERGINPIRAAEILASSPGVRPRNGNGAGAAAPVAPRPNGAAPPPPPAPGFQEREAARRAAAVVSGPGAQTPAGPGPQGIPAGANIKQAIEAVRANPRLLRRPGR